MEKQTEGLKDLIEELEKNTFISIKIKSSIPMKIHPNITDSFFGIIKRNFIDMAGCLCFGAHSYATFYDNKGESHYLDLVTGVPSYTCLPDESPIPDRLMKKILKEKYGGRYLFHKVQLAKFIRCEKNSSKGTLNLEGEIFLRD